MEFSEVKDISERIVKAVSDVFVGNELLLKKVLCAALANGHILFEDYPGLGKTLLTKVFAKVIGCDWRRIQFTSDLMPADIVGTKVWRFDRSTFEVLKGPIFTNVLLADEINRAPPKTQSALLEAMEERQVTIEGTTYKLERPFFVMATQNPIELEGTYPLPEAQIDRFIIKLSTGYAKSIEEECEILNRRIKWKEDDPTGLVKPEISATTFTELQKKVETVYVDNQILNYICEIVRTTREQAEVEVGASPRGGLALLKLSRSMAAICGRDFVIPDDVKLFAREALAHRIILKVEHTLEGINPGDIVERILQKTKVPKEFAPR